MWEVEYTDEFGNWWDSLIETEQVDITTCVRLLRERGPNLQFPYSSRISNSRYGNLRELRIQHRGKPYRILYAFDPRRTAILLIGGCKTGNDRWYSIYISQAEKLYDEHLETLKIEELI